MVAARERTGQPRCVHGACARAPAKGTRVTVALSGGVDSSVAALLLAQQDVDLRAVYMRNWSAADETASMQGGSGGNMGCAWQREWDDVQRVCRHLGGIPLSLVDLSQEYWIHVFEPALDSWAHGTTPNPDVDCNRTIKFGALMDRIEDASWLATGHYAQVAWRTDAAGRVCAQLERAADASKDQSYYLSAVPEERLRRSVFPLGRMYKRDVRALARRHALPTAENSESMGLCFVGERGRGTHGFSRFLDGYVEGRRGRLVSPDGAVLGWHEGLHTLTIGQRARIGGQCERHFVARKDLATGDVVVIPGKAHPMLQCTALECDAFAWVSGRARGGALHAQVRYRQSAAAASVADCGAHGIRVQFHSPMFAVAPGQTVALYDGDTCLGSGVIDRAENLA
ncbi:tRNA-5-taurinomethyluridine 2-sulfurtransferase [Malassezia sp. CBS 17886]|nr:tRNA-5-taurinomethyluridine 2-sulfurtransferase [Malassezia sp. CBS 17886]